MNSKIENIIGSEEETSLDNTPTKLEKLQVGFNEDEIILMFNGGISDMKNKKPEYATTFSPKDLRKFILALFEVGVQYQKNYKKDIGFGGLDDER